MHANSRPVSSNQQHLHPALVDTVEKHLATVHRKPVAPHNAAAFAALSQRLLDKPQPLVLDSFCGTGHSTALLADRHPGHLVVGIDKSADRLGKRPPGNSGNSLLLQAECEDIWQLLLQAGITVDYHYLLYPNPWPKAKHLQRRVHGHGSFPWLLQLGGRVELRSNWQIYVEEFGLAMHLAGCRGRIARVSDSHDMTLFEQKYRRSNHPLWRFTGKLAP